MMTRWQTLGVAAVTMLSGLTGCVFGEESDWGTLSGSERFHRIMDEIEVLELPYAAPWYHDPAIVRRQGAVTLLRWAAPFL